MSKLAKTLSAALVTEQKLTTQLPALMPNLSVLVNGTPMNTAQVVAHTEQHLTAEQELAALKAKLKEAQTAIKPMRLQERAIVLSVKAAAAVAFGNSSANYQALGFPSPNARKTTTTAEKAEATEKSLATREARGTKGPRQKASIHGTVPQATAAPATPASPTVVK